MSSPPAHLLVHCTCPADRAASLARALVEARVAACVNAIGGIESTYRWDGAIEQECETLLLIKTRADRFEALRASILAHHPYELPEIIAVPVAAAHTPYLDWISDSLDLA